MMPELRLTSFGAFQNSLMESFVQYVVLGVTEPGGFREARRSG
jgi:hypothetical protein